MSLCSKIFLLKCKRASFILSHISRTTSLWLPLVNLEEMTCNFKSFINKYKRTELLTEPMSQPQLMFLQSSLSFSLSLSHSLN